MKTNLRKLMFDKEVNQVQVVAKTGIDKNAISKYYNNTFKKIDREHIEILCKYFDCEIEELLELESE